MVLVVLMIVRTVIGLSAGAMRACSLLPESSHVPSATLSHQRQVSWRVRNTRDGSDRQRFGAVICASRQQETDDDQRCRSAD